MKIEIPENHPRYQSLMMRERVIEGYDRSIVAAAGVIAHGRGEAFDYLFGERTCPFAEEAVRASAYAFLLADRPVISVNGNVAALCPVELVDLSRATSAPLEVNLFYRTPERELAIRKALLDAGADEVLGIGEAASAVIPELGSERRRVDPKGIGAADLVFVPLEDGDRTESLVSLGKRVVTADLNPLSRTAQTASITIVDNIVRVLPALVREVTAARGMEPSTLRRQLQEYDNQEVLAQSLRYLAERLQTLSQRK